MINRQFGKVLRPVVLLTVLLALGCAQQMKSVQPETAPEAMVNAEIKSITVSDDASRIEISSDKSIVYTYYMLESPPRLIVDLAQTTSGTLVLPIDVNKGNVKRIDVAKHEFGSGVLSRVDVLLADKVEAVAALDQQDRKRLIITVPVAATAAAATPPAEPVPATAPVAAAAPQVEPAPATVPVAAAPQVAPVAETVQVVDPLPVSGETRAVAPANQGTAMVEKAEKAVTAQEPAAPPVVEAASNVQPAVAEKAAAVEVAEAAVAPAVMPQKEKDAVEPPAAAAAPAKVVLKPGESGLAAIVKQENAIQLEIAGGVDTFRVFRLNQPERLVIDIPKTRNAMAVKVVDINGFALGKARVGGSPEKLRIVFDAVGAAIPAYTVTKNGSGLLIAFGDARKKVEPSQETAAETIAPAKTVESAAAAVVAPAAAVTAAEAAPQAVAETKAAEVAKEVAPQAVAEARPPEVAKAAPAPVAAEPAQAAAVPPVAEVKPAEPAAATFPVAAPVVAAVAKPAAKPAAAAPVVKKMPAPKALPGSVEAVEFTQVDGVSRITIKTSGACVAGQPVRTGKGFMLALKGCRLPAKLQRQLDTRGFDSAINNIAPFPVKGKKPETRIAVNARTPMANSLKRDGDTLQWDFTEPVKVAKPAKAARVPKAVAAADVAVVPPATLDKDMGEAGQEPVKTKNDKAMEDAFVLEKASQPVAKQGKTYSGRKVTLEFSDADIRKIFQLLAEVSNQNFLMSDDVSGTISLKLVNVPWDQALDVILENKGLGMQKDGNIVQIRPKTKMKSLDDEAIEMRLTEEKKMPLSTVLFDVNFATLEDIKTQFIALKSKRPDSSVTSDMRTNKIIVVDIDPNIKKMRSLLESLDVPEKQVMIEARIVEAESSFVRNIGVQWGFGYQDSSASVANINSISGSMGGIVSSGLGTGAAGGGVSAGISFGKLLSNIQLDMRLSAAASVGQVKIVSTPKVLTVNNKAAKISQGQMIPYQNTSSTDGAKTEFIEAALSLEVTPHITADGSVNMKIKASNNTAGVGSPPAINKKEATTELVVRNGETTVIGGIYTDRETDGDQGVPYLSDIPLLGMLFKSNSRGKTKNEMLIFITPKIMN